MPDQDTTTAPTSHSSGKEQSVWSFIKEVLLILIIAFIISAIVQNLIARVFVIPSESMEDTLLVGDRIVVDKIVYHFSDPEPGDVVVFKGPDSWNEEYTSARSANPVIRGIQNVGSFVGLVAPDENNLVKRVIATPGETVQCLPGDPGVMVDGQKIDDSSVLKEVPFVIYPPNSPEGSQECGGPYFGPITVPEDHVWVMGDNRTNSKDSRFHIEDRDQGTVPIENIQGKVRAVIWPITDVRTIPSPQIAP